MPETQVDIVIIGAGDACLSCAYHLAPHAKVAVIEGESQPGYHSSGRSAAVFHASLGAPPVHALSRHALGFFETPPEGFTETPLLQPCGAYFTAPDWAAIDRFFDTHKVAFPAIEKVNTTTMRATGLPVHPDIVGAVYDPGLLHIDVGALMDGFLRGARQHGATLLGDSGVQAVARDGTGWRIAAGAETIKAERIVNAAGAWADRVAGLAGLPPLGIEPRRRTAITFDGPVGADVRGWPALVHTESGAYVKPEGGRLLASPGDATPSPPCDAAPEEIDIATAAHYAETLLDLPVRRVVAKWAGLRSFLPDELPALGEDAAAEGFYWCAALGGYGVQTAPATGRLLAAMITGSRTPENLPVAAFAPRRKTA